MQIVTSVKKVEFHNGPSISIGTILNGGNVVTRIEVQHEEYPGYAEMSIYIFEGDKPIMKVWNYPVAITYFT
jgi:hypothetical protein